MSYVTGIKLYAVAAKIRWSDDKMNEECPLPDSEIPTYIPKKIKERVHPYEYEGNDPNILMWR